MALLTLRASSVMRIAPSAFGAITAFEIHGAGSVAGCSSITSC